MIRRCIHGPVLLLLAWSAAALPLRAQRAGGDDPLAPAEIERRIAALEALDASVAGRDDALVVWREALQLAQRTAEQIRARMEFRAAVEQAQTRLENARQTLEQLRAAERPPEAEVPASDATIEQLEAAVVQSTAQLDQLRRKVESIGEEAAQRAARMVELPALIADAQARLEEATGEAPALADEPQIVTEARQARATLEQRAARAGLEALEAESASYAAREPLLPLRREIAERREQLWRDWQERLGARRDEARESEKLEAARRAEAQQRRLRGTVNGPIAEANATILRQEAELAARISDVDRKVKQIKDRVAEVDQRFDKIRDRIRRAGGLTDAIGLQLRQQRQQLQSMRDAAIDSSARRREVSELQLAQVQIEERLRELTLETIRAERRDFPPGTTEAERAAADEKTEQLLAERRQALEHISGDIDDLIDALTELDSQYRRMALAIAEYRNFVDERVLWIRSSQPIWRADLSLLFASASWLAEPERLAAVGNAALRGAVKLVVPLLLVVLLIGILLFRRPVVRARLRRFGERARQNSATEFYPTLLTLFWTLVYSAPLPLAVALLGFLISEAPNAGAFERHVGFALRATSLVLFALLAVRRTLTSGNLADAHFRWDERVRLRLLHALTIAIPFMVPIAFLSIMLQRIAQPSWGEVPDRALMLVAAGVMTTLTAYGLHPKHGVFSVPPSQPGAFWRTRWLWYLALCAVAPTLAALSLLGYHYSALELAQRLDVTLVLLLVAVLAHALGLRYMVLAKRRLAVAQALARHRAARERAEGKDRAVAGVAGEAPPPQPPAEAVDLGAVDEMSRRLLRSTLAIVLAVGLWFVWLDVFPALGYLEQVEISSSTQQVATTDAEGNISTEPRRVAITLADLLLGLIFGVLTYIAARNLPGLLELTVLQRLRVQPGERQAIVTLARYAIVAIGVVLLFGAVGIGWSNVQWLVAAVSVGLGFGLQEIFANFVSGLIILFERPVRVGDLVTVGGVDGFVTKVRIRATTILDFDNRELIVPNKEFVTSRLVNWTLTDPVTRVVIPVGIAYGSDTDKARDVLLRIAKEHELVLDKPAPSAIFAGFQDSSLLFELRVFIATRSVWLELMHTVHTRIDQAFRAAGIEIAFPQRDLHVRTAPALLEVFGDRRRAARAADADRAG